MNNTLKKTNTHLSLYRYFSPSLILSHSISLSHSASISTSTSLSTSLSINSSPQKHTNNNSGLPVPPCRYTRRRSRRNAPPRDRAAGACRAQTGSGQGSAVAEHLPALSGALIRPERRETY